MVYLVESVPTDNGEREMNEETTDGARTSVPSSISNEAAEDPIDIFLSKQDGLIYRDRDSQL